MISNKRKDSIRNIALIIHKYNNYEFPFRIVDFIRKLDKVKLIAYSYMISCGKFKNEKDIVARCTHSDDGATYAKKYTESNRYFIFYNDSQIHNEARIRFTLAHEVGHIVLGHFEDTGTLSRKTLSEEKYTKYESEADLFAAELLSPSILASDFKSSDEIKNSFYVSSESASITYNFVQKQNWIRNYRSKYPQKINFTLKNNVERFVKPGTQSLAESLFGKYYYCPKCKTLLHGVTGIRYCYICGNKNILQFPLSDDILNYFELIDMKGDTMMDYDGKKVNSDGKLIECAKCGQNLTSNDGEFCEICGMRIYNRCTGYTQYDEFPIPLKPQEEIHPCEKGNILSGQARFCPYCGCTSTLYEYGLLKSYDQFMENE